MIYINLILVFLVLVAIHEYGHYIVARLFKAEVTDFSIGFGKPLLKYTDRNGTTWKLSPIPLGGYVKIKGLDNIFSPNPNDEQGSFQSLTLFQKILVLLAGSIFNILSAWFALFCIFFFFGIVSLMPIIGSVSENSSAFENDQTNISGSRQCCTASFGLSRCVIFSSSSLCCTAYDLCV